jgi:hypothetical protein
MTKLVVWIAAIAWIASSSVANADKVFRVGKGATWDCGKDPVVSILHGNATYTLKGSCTSVTLTGGNNTLTIEGVGSISITGAHNNIAIGTVDSIAIVGSDNTVTYKGTAHGDAPSVSKVGSNNTVSSGGGDGGGGGKGEGGGGGKGDGGGGGGGGKTSDKPATDAGTAGAQVCAKRPTAVINDGAGNYKLIGPCTRIVVNGGDNTLLIDTVKELVVNGSTNTITVGSTDRIAVSGGENKITYKKGISGAKANVTNTGEGNKIGQAK